MKVAVCAIAKNEEKFVSRWADSCKEADYRFILDTGSTDKTLHEIIANDTIHWAQQEFTPWRFDHARNAVWSHIPDDIDYVIWLDMDEVLKPGWRQALETTPSTISRPRYRYVWSWNPDGSEGLVYAGDKICSRKNYQWVHPCHEVLTPIGVIEEYFVVEGLEIHHHPDHTKSRAQYFDLLKLAVEEKPTDPRNQFYLARELFFTGDYGLAQYHFNQHLQLSRWNPERAASHRYLAKIRPEAQEHHLFKAVSESPARREAWVELAQMYHNRHDWERCRSACLMALAVTEKPLDYLCEGFAWGWLPHDLMAVSSYNLGDFQMARVHGRKAVELSPDDDRLRTNLTFYE